MIQAANNIDKTRIAKNTMLLYIRMIIAAFFVAVIVPSVTLREIPFVKQLPHHKI